MRQFSRRGRAEGLSGFCRFNGRRGGSGPDSESFDERAI
jgi:hypothetical protein